MREKIERKYNKKLYPYCYAESEIRKLESDYAELEQLFYDTSNLIPPLEKEKAELENKLKIAVEGIEDIDKYARNLTKDSVLYSTTEKILSSIREPLWASYQ